jgi:hypothetical protein
MRRQKLSLFLLVLTTLNIFSEIGLHVNAQGSGSSVLGDAASDLIQTASLATDNVVEIENLFQNMIDSTDSEVDALDATFERDQARLEDTINGLLDALNQQDSACAQIEADVQDLTSEQYGRTEHLYWISNRTQENDDRSTLMREKRCEANMLFTRNLKENRQALKGVVQFKEFFAKWGTENGYDATELESATAFVQSLHNLNLITDDQLVMFSELKNTVTQAPVDNTRGELEVAGLKYEKNDLIKVFVNIISELETKVRESIKTLQENEIRASSEYADFRDALEAETAQLIRNYQDESQVLAELLTYVSVADGQAKQCRSTQRNIEESLYTARQNLVAATATYNKKRDNLLDEVETFEYLLNMYQSQTLQYSASKLTKRVDEGDYSWEDSYNYNFDWSALHRAISAARAAQRQGSAAAEAAGVETLESGFSIINDDAGRESAFTITLILRLLSTFSTRSLFKNVVT